MKQSDTPVKYTLGEAAKATGKSKPTISRAIKKGTISGTKNHNGEYELDPAEVHRVWPMLQANSNDNGTGKQSDTPNNDNALQREIELLRERLADKDSVIDDLRVRLDREGEERRATQARLEHLHDQRDGSSGLFGRLLGRK